MPAWLGSLLEKFACRGNNETNTARPDDGQSKRKGRVKINLNLK